MEFKIYGLSRSGNHAIIFWMCHNISDDIIEAEDQVYFDKENKICFVNNAEIYSTEFRDNIDTKSYENIIRSYEDSDFTDQDVSRIGNGSSFGGVKLCRAEDYLKRYEKIKLPKDIVEFILADEELAHINKDLFDIEIKNIRF